MAPTDDKPTVGLDELAAWIKEMAEKWPASDIRPSDFLRPPWHLRYNESCSALKALEARGDLERIPGPTIAYRPAPPPQKPAKGLAQELAIRSEKMRADLKAGDLAAVKGWLDAIGNLLLKLMVQEAGQPKGYALPLTPKEHGALLRLLDWCLRESPEGAAYPADTPTLRAIHNRMGGGSTVGLGGADG